jgi:ABC-2 type transport system permease protein
VIDAMRSEWFKLRSVTSTVVLLCFVVGVSIGLSLLTTAVIQVDDPSLDITVADRLSFALAGVSTSLTLLAVVGVLLITQEFRFNTLRVTFAAVPRRPAVILAKAIVLALVALIVSAAMVAFSTALGAAVLSARDAPIDFGISGTSRVLFGAVLLSILYTLIGLAVGAIVRSQALALVLVIVWPLLVEGIFGAIFPQVGKFMPFAAANAMLTIDEDPDFFSPWFGAAYLAGFTVVLLIIGSIVVNRRDA